MVVEETLRLAVPLAEAPVGVAVAAAEKPPEGEAVGVLVATAVTERVAV